MSAVAYVQVPLGFRSAASHAWIAMYTLYGYKGSGSAAIECALEVTGVPYRIVAAASWDTSSGVDALSRLNPLNQVPTLVTPDGTVLSESAAILIHLGLEFPDAALLPHAPARRATAIRGLVFIAANCYSAISVIDFPERWLAEPGDEAKENLKAGSKTRLHANWEIFADSLAPGRYLCDDRPGALDLLAAVVSRWGGAREHLARTRPALVETLRRIDSEERFRAVFLRHWHRN
jgi:GST-like protein